MQGEPPQVARSSEELGSLTLKRNILRYGYTNVIKYVIIAHILFIREEMRS